MNQSRELRVKGIQYDALSQQNSSSQSSEVSLAETSGYRNECKIRMSGSVRSPGL
jgi:hypothetical protein